MRKFRNIHKSVTAQLIFIKSILMGMIVMYGDLVVEFAIMHGIEPDKASLYVKLIAGIIIIAGGSASINARANTEYKPFLEDRP